MTAADRSLSTFDEVFRREYAQIVGGLVRRFGDYQLAEDAAQEAVTRALQRWPEHGIPDNPGAWLMAAARNYALDQRTSARARLEIPLADHDDPPAQSDSEEGHVIDDDRLRLMFTCCHPALSREAQTALTLRLVAGLTVDEIARAFLVPPPTIAQRLVRAKHKLRDAGVPFRVPPPDLFAARLPMVCQVVYLVFNEGYTATAGSDLIRVDLCREAIRLARLLVELLPQEPEAAGMLALFLLQDARRPARLDATGEIVLLPDQDRSLWLHAQAAEGREWLERSVRSGQTGVYQLQARIAAQHSLAADPDETDWREILRCYDQLIELQPSPVVALSRAVAVAMVDGVESGLSALEDVARQGSLDRYFYLQSARGQLLLDAGRHREAHNAFEQALNLAGTDAERRFIARQLDRLEQRPPRPER